MNDKKNIPSDDILAATDKLVAEFLTNNPEVASALATFDVAQEEYRKSLLAMTSVQIITSGSTNVEA